ncbi:MAG: type II toxin-antitoxin system RelE/ParE family toxin [Aliarcobacter sp.]|nr:type II toxin-antitoxin system RelE/ParE family toxin [Aliarcobacter sp.]
MNLKIISLESFSKDVKKLYKKNKKLPQDLKNLNETLLENPKVGIELSSKLYKMRLENSSSNIGKSGGFRVIYYYLDEEENIYLLKIYSKTEIENIKEEILIKLLKSQL